MIARDFLSYIYRLDLDTEYILKLIVLDKSELFNNEEKKREFINIKIDSSIALRPKKKLINEFLDSSCPRTEKSFKNFCRINFENMLREIILSEQLYSEKSVREFMDNSFRFEKFGENSVKYEEFIYFSRSNFAEFNKKREEVKVKLKNLFDIFKGFIKDVKINYTETGFPVINIRNIKNGKLILDQLNYCNIDKFSKSNILFPGEIAINVLSTGGATPYKIGMNRTNQKFLFTQHLIKLDFNNEIVDNKFFCH
ncbi:hypothetical protein PVNG_02336 [Plasmodium vivax North Korean]|uniref:Type I restriction enzyme R protein C-terminal domain-containing protein n=1 Tax=Plasmodium vivax North Korean TaxID=1035514 RepID=A0A0J9W6K5_PLAVI|nr:hypothetical protein PVNG_02336 [Plasmodium vivax North Korean]